MALSDREIARYARQLLLPGMGEGGQERLRSTRLRLVGGGPSAGPALLCLAEAGVGTLWVDDPEPAGAGDPPAWIAPPGGVARGAAAAAAARAANGLVEVDVLGPGARATAVLVCAARQEPARAAAEEARLLGLPHAVAEVDGDGGAVTVVPPGAPCYACSFRAARGPPTPAGAAAVGALAALEMVLLLTGASQEPRARRTELVRGQAVTRPTVRVPGCACARELSQAGEGPRSGEGAIDPR